MRIERNFYEESKKRLDLAEARRLKEARLARQNDEDALLYSLEKVLAEELRRKNEKLAAGRCLAVEEYEAIEQLLFDLAERINLNITSDIQGGTGIITLIAPRFDLNRDKDPESVHAFLRALTSADRLFFNAHPEQAEPLVQLTLLFDLAV